MKAKSGFSVSILRYFAYALVLAFSALLFSMPASGQHMKGSHWVIIKRDSSVINVKKMYAVRLDTLVLLEPGAPNITPVDSIISVRWVKKGSVAQGVGGGALLGALAGSLLGFTLYLTTVGQPNEDIDYLIVPTVALTAVGVIGGGIIGYVLRNDEVYEMGSLPVWQKSEIIADLCTNKTYQSSDLEKNNEKIPEASPMPDFK